MVTFTINKNPSFVFALFYHRWYGLWDGFPLIYINPILKNLFAQKRLGGFFCLKKQSSPGLLGPWSPRPQLMVISGRFRTAGTKGTLWGPYGRTWQGQWLRPWKSLDLCHEGQSFAELATCDILCAYFLDTASVKNIQCLKLWRIWMWEPFPIFWDLALIRKPTKVKHPICSIFGIYFPTFGWFLGYMLVNVPAPWSG